MHEVWVDPELKKAALKKAQQHLSQKDSYIFDQTSYFFDPSKMFPSQPEVPDYYQIGFSKPAKAWFQRKLRGLKGLYCNFILNDGTIINGAYVDSLHPNVDNEMVIPNMMALTLDGGLGKTIPTESIRAVFVI